MNVQRPHRETKQRRLILDALKRVRSHPTADEVYGMVRRRMPRISLATVYRNLDVLAEHGEIRVLEAGGAPRRFDADLRPHTHVRCVECGRVADAPAQSLGGCERAVGEATGYEIRGYRLEFIGVCPDCTTRAGRRDGGADVP